MVTLDCADPDGLAKFWMEAVGYQLLGDYDGYLVLAPVGGEGLRLGLQKVPEERLGKNRAHVDWSTDDREAEVQRLIDLGANVVAEHHAGSFAWTVLTDPEGNEFCVAGRE